MWLELVKQVVIVFTNFLAGANYFSQEVVIVFCHLNQRKYEKGHAYVETINVYIE